MRLMPQEIAAIDLAARECFAPRSMVRLFGSRLDDSRRGGDIDLLVEPPLLFRFTKLQGRTLVRLWVGLQPDAARQICSAVLSGSSPTHSFALQPAKTPPPCPHP
jgi:hypothetical protein